MKTNFTDSFNPLRLALMLTVPFLPMMLFAESGEVAVNGVAVKVNGHAIMASEVSFLLTPTWKNLREQFPEGGDEFKKRFTDAKKDVIQGLIDRHLLIDQFANLGLEIAPESIDDEIQREVRDFYGGEVDQLRGALNASRLTMDGFRKLLHDRLLESELKKQQLKAK